MNMENQKSILDMAHGAIQERTDYEMSRIIQNILDANTKATAPRTLTVTLKFTPDDDRKKTSPSPAPQRARWPQPTPLPRRSI
jgi:hypothetical protein